MGTPACQSPPRPPSGSSRGRMGSLLGRKTPLTWRSPRGPQTKGKTSVDFGRLFGKSWYKYDQKFLNYLMQVPLQVIKSGYHCLRLNYYLANDLFCFGHGPPSPERVGGRRRARRRVVHVKYPLREEGGRELGVAFEPIFKLVSQIIS